MKVKITIGHKVLTATMIHTNTTRAFMELLPLTIEMTELHNNEKYGQLPNKLPGQAIRQDTIHAGDLMLWNADYKSLVLFYKTVTSSYSYVKLGTIDNLDELEAALGTENVKVKFEAL
ncbi:cyclophilin-like fold protein [Myroides odoratus]|uniref:cyclophilin-like fold protein n=1 Tax=Myroides odoratus TaxID=256 RepID=UPI0039B04C53